MPDNHKKVPCDFKKMPNKRHACFLGMFLRSQKPCLTVSCTENTDQLYDHKAFFCDCQAPFFGLSGILFGIVMELFGDLTLISSVLKGQK